ncbi:MAG: PH domain-containing protein [Candidatus Jorgensenbacteria bacterium]|nr:PH domain-containing protein [Candidatus Jorgensenbacteria bacterium]
MQIAQSKTREQFPLSNKKIIKKTIAGTISYAIFFLIIVGFFSLTLIGGGLNSETQGTYDWLIGAIVVGLLGLLTVIFFLTYLYERWYFAVYFYDLTPDFIQIKKGPITPREITIPYERIQDVYVDQDLFDRIFGLYDVHLSSATASSGMEAHIDGVEKQAAEGLRAILLETIKQRISKNRFTNSTAENQVS